jgi:hypothetical protein
MRVVGLSLILVAWVLGTAASCKRKWLEDPKHNQWGLAGTRLSTSGSTTCSPVDWVESGLSTSRTCFFHATYVMLSRRSRAWMRSRR